MSDWWDDFSNNLATDLGPLVSLFGAAPTKQYLSECLTVTDVIIFATCPLGILTAVVSVIRVYGSPSLRAFVGRAQEGGGNAEAELCSSTSRDVCEIFIENGEIARVLGRPEILKFVHDSETRDEDFYPDGVVAGIFFPQEYFDQRHGNFCSQWKEVNVTEQPVDEEDPSNEFVNGLPDIKFAPNPNFSLNVGIKPRSQFWFVSAAILRVLLQSFVLAWAILTRYSLGLLRGGSRGVYSVPLTIIGTVLLCNGMALCATLIERSTQIRVFRRTKSKQKARLYWVQPGSQVICDQVFDSFCYTHSKEAPLITDTTSWKMTNDTHIFFVDRCFDDDVWLRHAVLGVEGLSFISCSGSAGRRIGNESCSSRSPYGAVEQKGKLHGTWSRLIGRVRARPACSENSRRIKGDARKFLVLRLDVSASK